MKKILALLLALMMAFSLVACGSSGDAGKDDGNKDAAADTNEPAADADADANAGDGKVYEIVALAKSIATDNWQMFGAGVEAAAAELGADKVHVTFDGASAATAAAVSVRASRRACSSPTARTQVILSSCASLCKCLPSFFSSPTVSSTSSTT